MRSHYVPRLILKHFTDENGQLSLIKANNGGIETGRSKNTVFSEKGYYSDELEKLLADKIEEPFGDVLDNAILKGKNRVVLTREQSLITRIWALSQLIRKDVSTDFFGRKPPHFFF